MEEQEDAADELVPTRLGASATLECIADGNPHPTVSWRFGQKQLAHTGSALYLPSVAESDLGKYTCEARSPLSDFSPAIARRYLIKLGKIIKNYNKKYLFKK